MVFAVAPSAEDKAGRRSAAERLARACPRDWVTLINRPETEAELDALRRSVQRGRPFGSKPWQKQTAKQLGLNRHSAHAAGRERTRAKG